MSFYGKPVAVIGTSGSGVATAAAQQHLRAILGHFSAVTMGQPEGFIQDRPGLFTDDGQVTDESTAGFLVGYLEAFNGLISRVEHASTLVTA
jgi:chromate reductase